MSDFGFLLIGCLLAVGIAYYLIEVLPKQVKQKRIERVILQLKQAGVKFYMKTANSVTGVTRADTHRLGERTHHFLVENGKLQGWDKVVIYASPTFTFAVDEQSRRPIHTGIYDDLVMIVDGIIHQVTGYKLSEFDDKEKTRILEAIIKTDSRLYVPYSGKEEEGKRDFERYGKTTLEDARRSIAL